jgi:hypothetical protein
MGFRDRLNVAVIDDRERTTTVPDQKIILIACDTIQEAHYICAFLSSAHVASILNKYLGIDASTHILDFIGMKSFSATNKQQQRLADLSIAAHSAVSAGRDPTEIEKEIDAVVDALHEKQENP